MQKFSLEFETKCDKFGFHLQFFNTKVKDIQMATQSSYKDASFLCHQLLVHFRDLYKQSPAEAMLRYRFQKDQAEKIVNCSMQELDEYAQRGVLCFQLELPTASVHHV
jgi:hypothetical protein